MSEPSIDPGLFAKAGEWIVGLFATMTGLIYKFHRGQIVEIKAMVDGLSATMSTKAEGAEMNRQRDNITKLFDELKKHSDRDEDMHRTMMKVMADNHAEILRALASKADRRA